MDTDARGRFLPGNRIGREKGGRPKGSVDFRTALGKGTTLDVLEAIREGVKARDARFVALAVDRLWPALSRQELTGMEGKPIELAHAEQVAAELPTDVLRELDALAERVNAERGQAKSRGNGAAH